MLRYNSVSGKFEGYQGGAWQDILTTGVLGGASAPDRGIQFNSGSNFAASANMVYSSQGAFMVSGTHTGVGAPPVTGAGTRMFFDPNKSALRAGNVTGTQWDDASIGAYSVALGQNVIASGLYSTAIGSNNSSSGTGSVALGINSVASNAGAVALGQNATASGLRSAAIGMSTVASGNYAFAVGSTTTASGGYATATGLSTIASGEYSTAMGRHVVTGNGTAASGFGDGSLAIGLIDNAVTITTPSQVRGIQSYGIFMGDQDGLVMTANNTMGLFGGQMVIDPAVPATQLSARATLDLGASTDAILFRLDRLVTVRPRPSTACCVITAPAENSKVIRQAHGRIF